MKHAVRQAIQRLIRKRLDNLEEYIDLLDSSIRKHEKHLGERIDRATDGMSEEDKPWFIGDQFGDEIGSVTETLLRLRGSGLS